MFKSAPWIEKYRATSLDAVQDQDIAVKIAKKIMELGRMPINLIFVGPPGTGKTTIAKIIAKDLLGKDAITNLLEKNASEEVRMKFLRTILKNFISVFTPNGKDKIVILDEADNIPSVDQQALRRIIEKSHKNCKFILICNYLSEIISPIQSRCAIIRFGTISDAGIKDIIASILSEERLELPITLDKFSKITNSACNGDVRLLVNTLQACDKTKPIESFRSLLGIINPSVLRAFYLSIIKGRYDKVLKNLNIMQLVSPRHFLLQLENYILEKSNLSENLKAKMCRIIADYDERLTLSGNQEIQLLGCIAKLCFVFGGDNNE